MRVWMGQVQIVFATSSRLPTLVPWILALQLMGALKGGLEL